jgi:hypothetical protein
MTPRPWGSRNQKEFMSSAGKTAIGFLFGTLAALSVIHVVTWLFHR